jgi:transcriptional regulator with XRE-family HTH domain
MKIGSKIVELRKENNLSRDELGKNVGTSGAVIGRYERNEITPSIEVAAKMANALNVSLDFLVGNTSLMIKDKKILERLENIDRMSEQEKNQLFNVVDALIRDFNAKQAYS